MFWVLSVFILLLAGLVTFWPLIGRNSSWKWTALSGVLLLPVAGYFLYQGVGTPLALDASVTAPTAAPEHSAGGDMASMTEQLRQRLMENPEQVEGWVLLGRSYKTLQQYPQALEALETANRLRPNQPLILIELVEARLFVSGDPRITPEMTTLLDQAMVLDPSLQKGLWLLGIAASQRGDDDNAIEWWQKLLQVLDADSPIKQSVTDQIAQANERLGREPEATPTLAPESQGVAQGVAISIELSAKAGLAWPQLAAGAVPPGSVLFIIARATGPAGGPPLGVRRVRDPEFPLQISLSDADSMMAQRPISSATQLEIQARLSRTGQPTAAAGDWQSVALAVPAGSKELTTLILDQEVE